MGAEPAPDHERADETGDPFVGPARSPEAARRLDEHDKRIYLPLLLSAILPIVVAASRAATDSRVSIVVNVVAWLVFVYDLFIHMRYVRHYLRTKVGIFDLSVVILTAPWFLLPGFSGSQILMLARLARLVRLFFVSKSARQLGRRLGSVGLFAVAMLLFCSWMAYVAEHPTNPGFDTFGDALWWGIVTLTTVGYGDIVPHTQKGRFAGVFLMLTGIATLGIISGTLASAFRSVNRAQEAEAATEADQTASAVAHDDEGEVPADVRSQLSDLQAQLATMEGQLATLVARSNAPPPG